MGVAYDADIDQSREVLETVPGKVDDVLQDPPPQIFLKELGGSSVDWQVRLWCQTPKYWDVHQGGIRATKKALDEAKLRHPLPADRRAPRRRRGRRAGWKKAVAVALSRAAYPSVAAGRQLLSGTLPPLPSR